MESAPRRCSSTARCRSSSTLRAAAIRSRRMCATRFMWWREAKVGSSTADDGIVSDRTTCSSPRRGSCTASRTFPMISRSGSFSMAPSAESPTPQPSVLGRLALPDLADAADRLFDLRIAQILDGAGAGDIDLERVGGIDDGLACAADFDHRFVAGELARLKRAGAGKVDALALDLAGNIGLDGTRTVEPERCRLQVADPERARSGKIKPQLAGFEAVGRHGHGSGDLYPVDLAQVDRYAGRAASAASREP